MRWKTSFHIKTLFLKGADVRSIWLWLPLSSARSRLGTPTKETKPMAYSSAADVKTIIETSLADASITELIAIADADIDDLLSGTSLGATLKKKCSMMLTAAMIADGNPKNYSVGDARVDMGNRARSWRAEVNRTIREAKAARVTVKSTSYQHIDEDARYTQ